MNSNKEGFWECVPIPEDQKIDRTPYNRLQALFDRMPPASDPPIRRMALNGEASLMLIRTIVEQNNELNRFTVAIGVSPRDLVLEVPKVGLGKLILPRLVVDVFGAKAEVDLTHGVSFKQTPDSSVDQNRWAIGNLVNWVEECFNQKKLLPAPIKFSI